MDKISSAAATDGFSSQRFVKGDKSTKGQEYKGTRVERDYTLISRDYILDIIRAGD